MIINTFATAIKRKSLSRPAKNILKKLNSNKHYNILDYGCGYGTDVVLLNNQDHIECNGFDPNCINPNEHVSQYLLEYPKNHYDIVMMNYVLCVIPDKVEAYMSIGVAWARVKPEGLLFITVRAPNEIEKNAKEKKWKRYNEYGYISSEKRKTFQGCWTTTDLLDLTKRINNIKRAQIIYNNKSYITLQLEKEK